MNLQSEISPELWEAISKSYEARHHSNAITDAVHYLSGLIREKAGVDGDGSLLIGQAFGGDTPKLQVNRLQTESEKNEQKGFQELLRGLYTGIRNPRSHGHKSDTPETSNAVILFINYLITVINQAKLPFTIEEWTERVFEPYFVVSEEYAKELVSEIPPGKRLDTLITVYQKRDINHRNELQLIIEALVALLGEAQKKDFLKIVSGVLRSCADEEDIMTHLAILWPEAWNDLDKIVKMRLEQLVIDSIRVGRVEALLTEEGLTDYIVAGDLGASAEPYIQYFLRRRDAISVIIDQLRSNSWEAKNYFIKYFLFFHISNCKGFEPSFGQQLARILAESDRSGFFFATVKETFWGMPQSLREAIVTSLQASDEAEIVEILEDTGNIPF